MNVTISPTSYAIHTTNQFRNKHLHRWFRYAPVHSFVWVLYFVCVCVCDSNAYPDWNETTSTKHIHFICVHCTHTQCVHLHLAISLLTYPRRHSHTLITTCCRFSSNVPMDLFYNTCCHKSNHQDSFFLSISLIHFLSCLSFA